HEVDAALAAGPARLPLDADVARAAQLQPAGDDLRTDVARPAVALDLEPRVGEIQGARDVRLAAVPRHGGVHVGVAVLEEDHGLVGAVGRRAQGHATRADDVDGPRGAVARRVEDQDFAAGQAAGPAEGEAAAVHIVDAGVQVDRARAGDRDAAL